MQMETTQQLELIKTQIENMPKNHQIEILKILNSNSLVKLNENKSGIYVNLSFLPQNSLTQIKEYISYVQDQEKSLITIENTKNDFAKTYFEDSSEYVSATM